MRRRAPWLLFGLAIGVNSFAYTMGFLGAMSTDEQVISTVALSYGFVGLLVASRQPDNAIGWLFLALFLTLSVNSLAVGYSEAAEAHPERFAAAYAEWVSEFLTVVWIALAAIFVPLLFPNGRSLSPRWRYVIWLAVAAIVLSVTGTALRPGYMNASTPVFLNPAGIPGTRAFMDAMVTAGNLGAAASCVLACASMFLRYRRSHGKERLQMRWFTLVVLIMGLFIVMSIMQVLIAPDGQEMWLNLIGAVGWFGFLFMLALGMPVAVGVAILNHKLFDIDRLINRTIVYAVLTVALAITYAGLVIGLQELLRPLSGGSDLAVVITTLSVAALFLPARSRVQESVDRRFNRRAYDTARTINSFSARLRDQIDLDTLRYELLTVVDETMQPSQANVWLRPGPGL